jgi:FMN phosphatase YigB (HAD superfamily)
MINGIFFDAGGILYRRKESSGRFALRLITEQGLGGELSVEEEARLRTVKEQASNGWISAQSYWEEVMKSHQITNPDKRAELLVQILQHVNTVEEVPGARETVKALKQRGFVLGVISSTMYPVEWKKSWLAAIGVLEYIEIVACSTELGWDKQHPTIFWAAINKAKMNPWQTAYVANGARELTEAHHLGMATVAALYDPDAKADFYVQTLTELLDVPIFQR